MNLSPLNFLGLMAGHHLVGQTASEKQVRRDCRIERITVYICPTCDERHDDRDDAIDCCDENLTPESAASCPVCSVKALDHRDAADCCLWKDIDAPTRWRIADAVEAGGTWAEQLGLARP